VYTAVQQILAPGAEPRLTRLLHAVNDRIPAGRRVIDIGCGPSSRLWRLGLHPVGVDFSESYTSSFAAAGETSVVASATSLPFTDGVLDATWSIGLFHHLTDAEARTALHEMVRVTRLGGTVVVFDGVLPEPAWARPHIWAQRRLDRGRYMRRQSDLEELLPSGYDWHCRRVGYSLVGHEGTLCTLVVR
jgi:SAM-dependent methyltransferase